MLAADTLEKSLEIVRDLGVGAANACSINLTFLKAKPADMKIYNIEMGPGNDAESVVDCLELDERAGYYIHCNT